ncbi:MAG: flavodoxin [Bacteroidota bacterium]|nr:flavodoxin [Bacteroidota bacterium]
MKNIGIFYGSSTGNTEAAAKQIQKELGEGIAKTFDVANAKASDIEQFSNLIFGSSTWGIGDMQDDFEDFLSQIKKANLEGKKAAIFGFGDQEMYADSYVDAIGEIYETLDGKGCQIVGKVSTDGYEYDESKAVVDGQFVGLPLDEENQSNLTDNRIKHWVEQLKNEFN